MESFYRQQRKKHRVLLTPDGQPEGGQWNFDADNRKPWKGTPDAPTDTRPCHDHRALWQTIEAAGVQTMGQPQAEAFRWPLNRSEALQQLDHFINEVLPHFGAYQDAMASGAPYLFHSLLSFALNIKMLDPREVVSAAEQAYRKGRVSLESAEGFIRQVLGWREFIRGMYWLDMPRLKEANHFNHQRALPRWFWKQRP